MEAGAHGRQPGIRPVRRAERRDSQEPRAGSRKRRHGVVQVSGNGVTSTGVIAGASVESTIEECTSYLPMECLGNGASEQTDDHGPRRLGLYGAGTSDETVTKLIGLKNYGAMKAVPGSRQHQRVHLDAGGLHRGRLEHLAHIDFQKPHHTLCELRRHDRLDGPRFGHRGRSEHLYGRFRMREPRRHAEYLLANRAADAWATSPVSLGTSSVVDGCTNYGDIVATNAKTHAGGLVCLDQLRRQRESSIPANYGNVITDLATYRGTLVANINNGAKLDNNTPEAAGIVQRRQLRDGADRRNQLHGLHRPDQDGQ